MVLPNAIRSNRSSSARAGTSAPSTAVILRYVSCFLIHTLLGKGSSPYWVWIQNLSWPRLRRVPNITAPQSYGERRTPARWIAPGWIFFLLSGGVIRFDFRFTCEEEDRSFPRVVKREEGTMTENRKAKPVWGKYWIVFHCAATRLTWLFSEAPNRKRWNQRSRLFYFLQRLFYGCVGFVIEHRNRCSPIDRTVCCVGFLNPCLKSNESKSRLL